MKILASFDEVARSVWHSGSSGSSGDFQYKVNLNCTRTGHTFGAKIFAVKTLTRKSAGA
jgi:hypothetical protein